MGECPYCKHQWTYKEKVLGYALKPRTRIKCPNCKEYLEPSTLSIIYDYIAILSVALFIFILIPIMSWPVVPSLLISFIMFMLYLLLFQPLTVRFKRYDYNIKDKPRGK